MNAEANTKPTKQPTEQVDIAMDDGRIVTFAGKRKLLKSSEVREDGTVAVRMDFRNGRVISFVCPGDLIGKAAGHGLEQKFGDETAGLDDVEDMVLAVEELAERLTSGEWNTKREAGNGLSGTSVLVRALVEYLGGKKTVEEVKAYLKPKSQAEKVALRNDPNVKPIVDRIEAEKAARASGKEKVDTGALLAELG